MTGRKILDTFTHSRGRHGAFRTLPKRWQAWVEMRDGFGDFSKPFWAAGAVLAELGR